MSALRDVAEAELQDYPAPVVVRKVALEDQYPFQQQEFAIAAQS